MRQPLPTRGGIFLSRLSMTHRSTHCGPEQEGSPHTPVLQGDSQSSAPFHREFITGLTTTVLLSFDPGIYTDEIIRRFTEMEVQE